MSLMNACSCWSSACEISSALGIRVLRSTAGTAAVRSMYCDSDSTSRPLM